MKPQDYVLSNARPRPKGAAEPKPKPRLYTTAEVITRLARRPNLVFVAPVVLTSRLGGWCEMRARAYEDSAGNAHVRVMHRAESDWKTTRHVPLRSDWRLVRGDAP